MDPLKEPGCRPVLAVRKIGLYKSVNTDVEQGSRGTSLVV